MMAFLKQVPEKKHTKYFRNNVKEWKANIIQIYVCIYFAIPSVSSKIKFAGYKWFSLWSPQHNQTDLLEFCYTADNFFFSLKENLGVYLCHHFHRKSFSPWRRRKWKSDGNSWRGSYRSVRSKRGSYRSVRTEKSSYRLVRSERCSYRLVCSERGSFRLIRSGRFIQIG